MEIELVTSCRAMTCRLRASWRSRQCEYHVHSIGKAYGWAGLWWQKSGNEAPTACGRNFVTVTPPTGGSSMSVTLTATDSSVAIASTFKILASNN